MCWLRGQKATADRQSIVVEHTEAVAPRWLEIYAGAPHVSEAEQRASGKRAVESRSLPATA